MGPPTSRLEDFPMTLAVAWPQRRRSPCVKLVCSSETWRTCNGVPAAKMVILWWSLSGKTPWKPWTNGDFIVVITGDFMMFVPTGWKPNQRFACFHVFHGVNGVGWGGVRWGNNVHLHCLTYMMPRCCTSSCTSSHTWCYAAVRRLALPHIYDATLVYVVLHFLTYMMQRYCMSSCTSSHIRCYVSLR